MPLKSKKVRNLHCPWFTSNINNLMNQWDSALKIWKKYRTQALLNDYRLLRNKVVGEIKAAKISYYSKKFDVNLLTQTLWRNIKEVGIVKQNFSDSNVDVDSIKASFAAVCQKKSMFSGFFSWHKNKFWWFFFSKCNWDWCIQSCLKH